jgi:hypothetical protein
MEYSTQNSILLDKLLKFYEENNNLEQILPIINGESHISLRLIDWFATNFAKKKYTILKVENTNGIVKRFKVYNDYKLKLKAYSKKRFDPFCRWDRINIPYKDDNYIQTTIGQLNFFKWILENNILPFIQSNFKLIQSDMDSRNSTIKNNAISKKNGTRKRREELSISASRSIKKEKIEIIVDFK